MKTKERQRTRIRNWQAVAAHLRGSAGPMRDKRETRGGQTNDQRAFLDELDDADNDEDGEEEEVKAEQSVDDIVEPSVETRNITGKDKL